MSNRNYIIAEVGVNHNGDINLALEMIKVAKKAGADAVKFQTFNTTLLTEEGAPKAKYQINESDESASDMLRKLELDLNGYSKIIKLCEELNIDFMSTPFDLESARFLADLGLKKFKIASGDITNYQLLKYVFSVADEVILSTGMSNIEEVLNTLEYLKKFNKKISILHCVSNYPTKYFELNLDCIQLLKDTGLDVGFSDHTVDNLGAVIAVSLGATILEKHFTLDKKMEGPDHKASLEPEELSAYVEMIRNTEICLGEKKKFCQESEKETKLLVRRGLYYNRDMKEGEIIEEKDLISKRPLLDRIEGCFLEDYLGKMLIKNVNCGEYLKKEDVI